MDPDTTRVCLRNELSRGVGCIGSDNAVATAIVSPARVSLGFVLVSKMNEEQLFSVEEFVYTYGEVFFDVRRKKAASMYRGKFGDEAYETDFLNTRYAFFASRRTFLVVRYPGLSYTYRVLIAS
jgi:hypothetical protein